MTVSPPTPTAMSYQVGGSLPTAAATYVPRLADQALWAGLLAGEFCYVLNARQMGKSSLRVQVMQRLQAVGVACAAVDITKIGSQNINSDQWYASLIGALVQGFGLGDRFQLRAWWRERQYLSPVQRLGDFIETVLLELIPTPLVIFIDEIDSLLSLPFATDDFFTWMRACYNQRVDSPAFQRLTFALLGVTTPANLIQDKQRTPFNIGRAIPLDGLTLPAASPLAQGLVPFSEHPEILLQAILDWTGGQPFLTQKLCRLAQQHLPHPIPPGQETTAIAQLVQTHILADWEHHDEPEHLKTIRNRILANEQRAGRILGLYQQLLQRGAIPADDSSEQIELRLTGLVSYQQGVLRVFNPIYENVFDLAWVEFQLAQLRPYGVLLQAWVDSGCQDTSRLLRGESLKEALAWASDKSLGDQDYQFLAASQDWQQQETQRTLLIERQEKQAMAAANRILSRASRQAKRLVLIAGISLGVVSVVAVIVGTGLVRTSQELQNTQASLTLEQESINILAQFPAQPLSSLVAAINNGRELYQIAANQPLSHYPTTRPILTLNTILTSILARNTWEIPETLVGSSITRTGQILTVLANGQMQFWSPQGEKVNQLQLSSGRIRGIRHDLATDRLAILTQTGRGEVWGWPSTTTDRLPRKLFDLEGLAKGLVSFKFAPETPSMAGIDSHGQVYVWGNSGNLQAQFPSHRGTGYSLAYAPDGETLATAGSDGYIRLWSLEGEAQGAWKVAVAAPVSARSITYVTATTLVGVGEDGILRIWNTNGQQLNQWRVSVTPAYFVGISPNGQTLLTLSEDNIIRLWTINGLLSAELSGHERFVTQVEFNPMEQRLVSSDRSGRIFVWDLEKKDLDWAANQASIWNAAFSADGERLATAGKNGSIKLWNIEGKLLQQLQASSSGVNALTFLNESNQIFWGSEDGQVGLWGPSATNQQRLHPPGTAIYAVASHPQEGFLAAANKNGQILIWANPENPPTVPTPQATPPEPLTIEAHQGAIWSLKFLPQAAPEPFRDQPVVVSTGQDGQIRFWQAKTGKLLQEISPGHGWLTSLQIAPDGQSVIVAGEGGMISQWELNGTQIRQIKGHLSSILSLALSQDGQMLASVAQDGIVRVWALSGQLLATYADQFGTTYSLDISSGPHQHLVIVGQNDRVHLEPLYTLPELLQQSCLWLADYRVIHADAQAACPPSVAVNP